LAFRIAIINDLSDYDPKTNTADKLSADHARDLLAKAQTKLGSDPRGAYKDVREAVDVLRKMSKAYSKARHESSPENG
jgi:hypothetical protein